MSNHHGNVILYFDVTLPIPDKLDSSDEKTLEEWAKRRAFNPVRLVQKLRYSDWEYGDDLLFEMRGGVDGEDSELLTSTLPSAVSYVAKMKPHFKEGDLVIFTTVLMLAEWIDEINARLIQS